MKQVIFSMLVVLAALSLSGCNTKDSNTKRPKAASEESLVMQKVDADNSSENVSTVNETRESQKQIKQVDYGELLNAFGNAYANYSSINDRNEKLKKLMTKECAEKNGINFDSAVKLSSKGEVLAVYTVFDDSVKADSYAIILECEQNGTDLKVLLLVKVKGDKIAEMTYNTVKQEY